MRTPEFQRNPRLEMALAALNGELATLGDRGRDRGQQPQQPTVLILGCARAGTTLTLQWLAASGRFAYPTNLIARFYGAPWIGARVQQILTDQDLACGDEFADVAPVPPSDDWFRSRLGKTRGLLAPAEFWYYWRRFFPVGEIAPLDEATWDAALGHRFAAELAAWEEVAGRPLVMKASLLNWNLPLLARVLPRAVFLHVRRDPLANLQSLLLARRAYYGRDDQWYSFKPPEYPALAALPVCDQLAAQLLYTERAIDAGLADLPPQRVLTVAYEDLCRDPAAVHDDLSLRLRASGGPALGTYGGPARFDASGQRRVAPEEHAALAAAWSDLVGLVGV